MTDYGTLGACGAVVTAIGLTVSDERKHEREINLAKAALDKGKDAPVMLVSSKPVTTSEPQSLPKIKHREKA